MAALATRLASHPPQTHTRPAHTLYTQHTYTPHTHHCTHATHIQCPTPHTDHTPSTPHATHHTHRLCTPCLPTTDPEMCLPEPPPAPPWKRQPRALPLRLPCPALRPPETVLPCPVSHGPSPLRAPCLVAFSHQLTLSLPSCLSAPLDVPRGVLRCVPRLCDPCPMGHQLERWLLGTPAAVWLHRPYGRAPPEPACCPEPPATLAQASASQPLLCPGMGRTDPGWSPGLSSPRGRGLSSLSCLPSGSSGPCRGLVRCSQAGPGLTACSMLSASPGQSFGALLPAPVLPLTAPPCGKEPERPLSRLMRLFSLLPLLALSHGTGPPRSAR